jgi:heme/copper-type cytochrome/quinol oxidase subunit 3
MEAPTVMDKNRLGMVLFILSEAIFFMLLILAYAYFRTMPSEGPTAASSLDPIRTGIFSLFLLSSSATVWLAGRSLAGGDRRRFVRWLAVTILFGLTFLAGQGLEWRHLLSQGTSISVNLFGTTFFTLTGFHGLHVIVGLVALSVPLGLTIFNGDKPAAVSSIDTLSLYWHFVDGVWIVIFSVVYFTLLLHP